MTLTSMDQAQLSAERAGLSARLTSLSRLAQIGAARRGPDGFSDQLLSEAGELLTRAGQRLLLSSEHTVVALAGGTGSGKSSLFNKLSGAEFSAIGVTRPVTSEAHACVWGVAGSGPLLEWLGVPRRYRYARSSALDSGEQSLKGLVLLDMPDHDSVMGHATDLVDKLVGLSDLMIWVLDPQKYADAAVHRRFLVPLAGHSEVVAVVLNQADLLTAGQIEDCVHDLRRLLDSDSEPAGRRLSMPPDAERRLAADFAGAAGVEAISDSMRTARELRAIDYIGWPVTWLADRIASRNPARKIRLGKLWQELRGLTTGPSGAQQAEIDNSLTALADEVTA